MGGGAIVAQHPQLRSVHAAQKIAQTRFAGQISAVGITRQHEGETPVALAPEHAAGVTAGRVVVRIEGRQGDLGAPIPARGRAAAAG